MIQRIKLAIAIVLLVVPMANAQKSVTIRVGAKHFNEGYILSEMIALMLEDAGFRVERHFNLGGTKVAFDALVNREIDVYPEYTGTISSEILRQDESLSTSQIRSAIAGMNLNLSEPYGFNNTYVLVMTKDKSKQLGIETVSDLVEHPELRVGVSYEFLKRHDGWEALAAHYALPQAASGLEHGLAYEAMMNERIDVTDAYSTDGEIATYDLALLEDDRHFFPAYHAVSLYHSTLPPEAGKVIGGLQGRITESEMSELNAKGLSGDMNHRDIAREFLLQKKLIRSGQTESVSDTEQIIEKTLTHLKLTLVALFAAFLVAIPTALAIYRNRVLSRIILYATGVLQTIPSIALLALMIPILGIGTVPALVALFLYALLPILRNTLTGLLSVDPELKKVASAIGLTARQRLFMIEIPLTMPFILSGTRTSVVISVGTATLAAFIGAGGLGEFIVTGLALNNTRLILMGAIPAATLAILLELVFEWIEKITVPKHLQQKV